MNNFLRKVESLVLEGDEFIKAHGPLGFHQKAKDLLTQARLDELFNLEEFIRSSLMNDFNSYQNYASLQFSDFPITVAMGESCFLDLYFWRRRPTVVHDHHFTGAFQCLEGVNVDLEFEFTKKRKLGLYHDLGTLELKEQRRLVKGDIAAIDLLDKFIHQNHHQAELTINACFRTPDIGETHLSNFLYSGLRYEKNPNLLNRGERIINFLHMGDYQIQKMNVTIDDALHFMIRNFRSKSSSGRFLELKNFMKAKVTQELDLDVEDLLQKHDQMIEQLENDYE